MENINDKRTKGKWEIIPDTLDRFHIAAKNRIIATINTDVQITEKSDEDEANAAFIVKACNNYENLVNALIEILELFPDNPKLPISYQVIDIAKQALYKTES